MTTTMQRAVCMDMQQDMACEGSSNLEKGIQILQLHFFVVALFTLFITAVLWSGHTCVEPTSTFQRFSPTCMPRPNRICYAANIEMQVSLLNVVSPPLYDQRLSRRSRRGT